MDATGQLWQSGGLVGKPVTFITSTASQGGGQEATILTCKLLPSLDIDCCSGVPSPHDVPSSCAIVNVQI